MQYEVDLALGRMHLHQLEEAIASQRVRLELLKGAGEPVDSAHDLLELLTQTRERFLIFIEHTSAR